MAAPSAVILEPQKIKSDTVSTVFPSISHEVMGPDTRGFVFVTCFLYVGEIFLWLFSSLDKAINKTLHLLSKLVGNCQT